MDGSLTKNSESVAQHDRPNESQLRDRSGIKKFSGAFSEAFGDKAFNSKAEKNNGGKDHSRYSTASVQNSCNRIWIDLNEMPLEVDGEEDLHRLVNETSAGTNSQNKDRRDSVDRVGLMQIKMAFDENSSGLERGISSAPVDEAGRSAVLPLKRKASEPDEKIVWPPVVIIENTKISYDGNTKSFKGLENEEIRKFMKAMKDCEFGRVLALYDRRGHRGKALVTFPPSYLGFLDAQALSECLQRANKGREEWLRVSRNLKPFTMDGWYTKDLVNNDGKRILYGYLAIESDMHEVDPYRKNVKRWSMESYAEKVLEPMKRIDQGREEARKKREELAKEAKHKTLVVEQNKSELDKATEELKKINKESQLRRRHEEEVEALHRSNFEMRKKAYDEDKRKKMLEFQQRETEIRTQVEQSKIQQEKEMSRYMHATQQLKDGIDEEKRKHEVRFAEQKQIETMEMMDLHSNLQVMMEDKLAELAKSLSDKKLKLQEEHNCQIMKHKKEIAAKKEELLESKLKELQAIENEVKSAKDATEQMHKEVQDVPVDYQNECIICFDEFVAGKNMRAFYTQCKHANVCTSCAAELWKGQRKGQRLCPTCKTLQTVKFTTLPAKFLF